MESLGIGEFVMIKPTVNLGVVALGAMNWDAPDTWTVREGENFVKYNRSEIVGEYSDSEEFVTLFTEYLKKQKEVA